MQVELFNVGVSWSSLTILAVDEDFDWALLQVLLHISIVDKNLPKRVNIEFIYANLSDQNLLLQLLGQRLIQLLQHLLFSFNNDEVEAFLSEEPAIHLAGGGRRSIHHSSILFLLLSH